MTANSLSEDDIALAGELSLGLLSPAEAAAARARAAGDPDFAAEVARWEDRLHPLLGKADVAAPDSAWQAIQTAISSQPTQDNASRSLRFWRGLSLASTAAALLLAVMLMTRSDVAPIVSAPSLVAALGSETGRAALTASYDPQTGSLTLTPVSLQTGALYPELWVIPKGGTARSLGIVTGDRATRVQVATDLRALMRRGATLAITPEPQGGAPGGKATGPVIASGTISQI
jgi:anti-sigma-K factor RskA